MYLRPLDHGWLQWRAYDTLADRFLLRFLPMEELPKGACHLVRLDDALVERLLPLL